MESFIPNIKTMFIYLTLSTVVGISLYFLVWRDFMLSSSCTDPWAKENTLMKPPQPKPTVSGCPVSISTTYSASGDDIPESPHCL